MPYGLLADLLVIVHLAFILFAGGGGTFLSELLQGAAEMFGFHGIIGPDVLQIFRRKAWYAGKMQLFAFGQRVADMQISVIENTDDVTGPGFLGQFAVLC